MCFKSHQPMAKPSSHQLAQICLDLFLALFLSLFICLSVPLVTGFWFLPQTIFGLFDSGTNRTKDERQNSYTLMIVMMFPMSSSETPYLVHCFCDSLSLSHSFPILVFFFCFALGPSCWQLVGLIRHCTHVIAIDAPDSRTCCCL